LEKGHGYSAVDEEADSELDSKELGIWFETDWSQMNIIVKKIVKNRWAGSPRCLTSIFPGDTLLEIDGKKINDHYMIDGAIGPTANGNKRVDFDKAMADIRKHFLDDVDVETGIYPTLKFRTVQEVNKQIREKAKKSGSNLNDGDIDKSVQEEIDRFSTSVKDYLPLQLEILATDGATIVNISPMDYTAKNDGDMDQSMASKNEDAKHSTGLKVKNELISHTIHF
jgi:hypothetical protein